VVELADTSDLGSDAFGRGGSTPSLPTELARLVKRISRGPAEAKLGVQFPLPGTMEI
jgi:hypothetical protein